jgi:N-acetylhexosamine 1-kinase
MTRKRNSCAEMTEIDKKRKDALAAAAEFQLNGAVLKVAELGSGHIHETYLLQCESGTYALQRINMFVFSDVDALMGNILRVTQQVRKKSKDREDGYQALEIIPTRSGQSFLRTDAGACWRLYTFVGNAYTVDIAPDCTYIRKAATAFGEFMTMLEGIADHSYPLKDTIELFHDTPHRFEQLQEAIEKDAVGRVKECGEEIDRVMSRQGIAGMVTQAMAEGRIPVRSVHNDTKINNVMFDTDSGDAVCVIDLDTVMHGSLLYDFGDMVRCMAGEFDEGADDPSTVKVCPDRFQALAEGYLEAVSDHITSAEKELLVFSGRLISLEVGTRFLADYLNGDKYFRIKSPDHNLKRTRVQLALIEEIESKEDLLEGIVSSIK